MYTEHAGYPNSYSSCLQCAGLASGSIRSKYYAFIHALCVYMLMAVRLCSYLTLCVLVSCLSSSLAKRCEHLSHAVSMATLQAV